MILIFLCSIVAALTGYERKRSADTIYRSKKVLNCNREVRQMVTKDSWYLDREDLKQGNLNQPVFRGKMPTK